MYTVSKLDTSVPAFLAKLWKLVEDPETDDLICWSPSGKSFYIKNQALFAKELLPHYYKHNNMASFVRQLNMYGFHKKVSVELGGLKCDKDEMEFAHQFFLKDNPYLIEHIKRKIATNKSQDSVHPPIKPELMNKMLSEVRSMRGRQEHLDSKLGAMKLENEALWRELALLRQKHIKQQQIVNKLIHFLVTLVQPARSVKRRYPLMIDDRQRKQNKSPKSHQSPTGPVIHELVDTSESDIDSEYIVAEMLENENSAVQSPEYNGSIRNSYSDFIEEDPVSLVDVKTVTSHEVDTRKRHTSKGKKKRKNKMPIKILIPSLENGEKAREEFHLLEMPDEAPVNITLLKKESVNSKPVPMATVHSSKLAAMAANINKSEPDIDVDNSVDTEDDVLDNNTPNLMKLQDILIVPEIINDDYIQNANNKEISDNRFNKVEKDNNQNDNGKSILTETGGELLDKNKSLEYSCEEKDKASTSSLKDLSLSRFNPIDASYRLESTEEIDNHLETMQTDLNNLRDMLCIEGCTLDANTLIGMFSADDPMTFGLPINPELNPNCEKEDDDQVIVPESINGPGGGELMAYNPTSNLDFDDYMFLENASSSLSTPLPTDLTSNILDHSDPLDLEDNKASLLDSLVTNMNSNS